MWNEEGEKNCLETYYTSRAVIDKIYQEQVKGQNRFVNDVNFYVDRLNEWLSWLVKYRKKSKFERK